MRLEQIKADDIRRSCPLDGVTVSETRKSAYAMTSITLTDAAGHTMVVEGAEYCGSVRVLVKAKPPVRKQFILAGEVFTGSVGLEVKVNETFDSRAAADTRKNVLEAHGANLAITEIEVEIPD
ncbi:MAG: hypothetical protein PHU85_13425 [Phycisphaerae bacterium]|nr:hypothetical protein [Phycisphaerae bacterium]